MAINSTSGAPSTARPNFPQFDAIRALAVFSVMFAHFGGPAAARLAAVGLDCGALGVRCFYVLSGFLITTILLADTSHSCRTAEIMKRFYARRILRIFPLYYGVLAVGVIIGIADVRDNLFWHASYLADWAGRGMGVTSHFWSLCVEEQFYLAWPIAVVGLRRRSAVSSLAVAIAISIIAAVTIPNPFLARTAGSFAYLGTGCALALSRSGHLSGKALMGGAVLCLLPAVLVTTRTLGASAAGGARLWAYWDAVAFGVLIARAAKGFSGFTGWILRLPPLRFVGRISYGVYVYHEFVPTALRAVGGTFVANANPYLRALAYLGCTLLIATASYFGFERMFLRLKERFE